MTFRAVRWVVAVMMTAAFGGIAGTPATGPEQLGAHWARVPDRTQVEFMIDALRSAARGSAAERIMRRNIHAGEGVRVIAPPAQSDRPTVDMEAGTAIADFPGTGHIRFERVGAGWQAVSGILPAASVPGHSTPLLEQAAGFSAGSTFIETPVSVEHGIDRLTRTVTREQLGRALFSTPGPTASYYAAHYMQNAPYVSATYVQFVVDPAWGRIVYGNMNAWIKSYDNLLGPTSIAVDPSGRVFVGETGRRQVTVLQLDGEGDAAQLRPSFAITGMDSPTAVAYSDNGTPLDPTDDYLYVADAVKGSILKYHIGSTGAELVASTDGFDSPTAIATGRWNGANNGFVYVVDNVGKRVRVLEDTGNSLATVAEYREGYDSYFNSVTVDHFGNAYLADLTLSRLVKLSASLDLLDEEQEDGRYASLAVVDIPFGRITVDGQGTTWAGFDQLFAVERWSDMSGVQRRTLGLRLKDVTFSADQDVSMISGRFVLTDFGLVKARVFDANGTLVRSVFSSAMVSGPKEIAWDRRDDSGRLVPPGEYRYELSGTTPYRQETVTATSRWTLPLYYDERGGADDPHLVRGTPLRWGTSSAAQDNDAVQFRFTGLNPAGSYSVRAEYLAPDSIARLQDLTTGNGIRLHEPVRVGPTSTVVGYVPIPSEAFSSGELLVSINRRGEGNAVVSRLVLKETGTSFTSSPDVAPVPTAYALDQNYPNPFNPATVIRYEIPAGGPVSLAVYDINGREIIQLVNEVKPAGVYEVRFDASRVRPGGLASGVYFYRVTAGQYSNTKKMVLIR